ncbi:curlin, partial [Pseudomonas sp. MOB-449]|nr:curlin [Pseudomonas sp. MOB-449]
LDSQANMTQNGSGNFAFSFQDTQANSTITIDQMDQQNAAYAEQLFGSDNLTEIHQGGTGGTGNESSTWQVDQTGSRIGIQQSGMYNT